MLENQVNLLLNSLKSLLLDEKEHLTQEEFDLLVAHKDFCSKKLLSIVEQKLTLSDSDWDENIEYSHSFYWSLRLLVLLNEPRTYELLIKLCMKSENYLENVLGDMFITEDLPVMLALTSNGRWQLLQPLIENNDIYYFIRDSCLRSCAFMLALQTISREEFVIYLQKHLQHFIEDEQTNQEICSIYVDVCIHIWPSECLDMVKELCALEAVDNFLINIDDVLNAFKKGEKQCIKSLQEDIDRFLESFFKEKKQISIDTEEDFKNRIKTFDYNREKLNEAITAFMSDRIEPQAKIGRNDSCICLSGKKYKKCCLDNKQDRLAHTSYESEMYTITFEPLGKRNQEELKIINQSYAMAYDNSENAPKCITAAITQYPDLPELYNYLFIAYTKTNKIRPALEILKKTVSKFPQYLFGLAEYACYFLRRGEPERVPELFRNCLTLKQLYPERDIFHVKEVLSFSYIMARYHLEICNFEQVKIHLSTIKQIDHDSLEVENIKKIMKKKLFRMEEDTLPEQIKTYLNKKTDKSLQLTTNIKAKGYETQA